MGKLLNSTKWLVIHLRTISENLLGKNISDILSENKRNELYNKLSEAFNFGKTTFESEYQFKNGILPAS
jgi:hypothetical protein